MTEECSSSFTPTAAYIFTTDSLGPSLSVAPDDPVIIPTGHTWRLTFTFDATYASADGNRYYLPPASTAPPDRGNSSYVFDLRLPGGIISTVSAGCWTCHTTYQVGPYLHMLHDTVVVEAAGGTVDVELSSIETITGFFHAYLIDGPEVASLADGGCGVGLDAIPLTPDAGSTSKNLVQIPLNVGLSENLPRLAPGTYTVRVLSGMITNGFPAYEVWHIEVTVV